MQNPAQEPGDDIRERAALAELGRHRRWLVVLAQLAGVAAGVVAGFLLYYFVAVPLYPQENPYAIHALPDWLGVVCFAGPIALLFTGGAAVGRRLARARTPAWIIDVANAWKVPAHQLEATTRLIDKSRL